MISLKAKKEMATFLRWLSHGELDENSACCFLSQSLLFYSGLTGRQQIEMLTIARDILDYCEIHYKKEWVEENREYFKDKVEGSNIEGTRMSKIYMELSNGTFSYQTIKDILDAVLLAAGKEESDEMIKEKIREWECFLGIAEVTIRDDVWLQKRYENEKSFHEEITKVYLFHLMQL